MAEHPAVSNVRYPGLKQDLGHAVAASQMENGFSNMLAFNVGNSIDDAKKFIDKLQVVVHAVSLGSTESLICIPYLTTMLYMPPERRTTFGVQKNTIRLSVGIEPLESLINDFKQALNFR